eukprot:TRINITY_DN4292_c0_g1_i5.p1 TRINITY_DN4292_c0_g1~~TRINITY_DN4292_c0_g1_i5.p1  ORF type:complete len:163 (+),score=57.05 TRINITY_DN4292_c0_g1_i5:580-1068(+)
MAKEIAELKAETVNEEGKGRYIVEELKGYVKELVGAYGALKELASKRLSQLKAKQISVSTYKNMINKIKEDGSKGAQLKMLNQMKQRTPFMTAIALKESNIRVALLGISAVANTKSNKLQACFEEIEQCSSLMKLAEEKCSIYREKHFMHDPSEEISLLKCS